MISALRRALSQDSQLPARNINLNFRGKLITVQSTEPDNVGIVRSTIIDCEGIIGSRGFEFGSGETSDAAVKGLTVIGGNLSVFGGAVYGVLILKLDGKIYEELKGIVTQMNVEWPEWL